MFLATYESQSNFVKGHFSSNLYHPGTNLSKIIIKIPNFSFKKIYFPLLSAKFQPFCSDLNVLMTGNKMIFTFEWRFLSRKYISHCCLQNCNHFVQTAMFYNLETKWHSLLSEVYFYWETFIFIILSTIIEQWFKEYLIASYVCETYSTSHRICRIYFALLCVGYIISLSLEDV